MASEKMECSCNSQHPGELHHAEDAQCCRIVRWCVLAKLLFEALISRSRLALMDVAKCYLKDLNRHVSEGTRFQTLFLRHSPSCDAFTCRS